jgi:hypothetical protein
MDRGLHNSVPLSPLLACDKCNKQRAFYHKYMYARDTGADVWHLLICDLTYLTFKQLGIQLLSCVVATSATKISHNRSFSWCRSKGLGVVSAMFALKLSIGLLTSLMRFHCEKKALPEKGSIA